MVCIYTVDLSFIPGKWNDLTTTTAKTTRDGWTTWCYAYIHPYFDDDNNAIDSCVEENEDNNEMIMVSTKLQCCFLMFIFYLILGRYYQQRKQGCRELAILSKGSDDKGMNDMIDTKMFTSLYPIPTLYLFRRVT